MTDKTKEFCKKFNRNVTCNDVVSGYVYDNWERTEMPDDIRKELFEVFRQFVVKGSRAGRRKRIWNAEYYTVKNCGILSRLWISEDKVEYCAGQDYTAEMGTLREVFAGDI